MASRFLSVTAEHNLITKMGMVVFGSKNEAFLQLWGSVLSHPLI